MAAVIKHPPQKDMLRPFLFLSLAFHTLLLVFMAVFAPLFTPKPKVRTITFNLSPAALAETPAPSPAIQNPDPAPAAPAAPQTPAVKETVVARTAKPAAPAPRPSPPVQSVKPAPAPPTPAPAPISAPAPRAVEPLPAPAPAAISAPAPALPAPPARNLAQEDNDSLASQVDNLLARATSAPVSAADYLSGGMWTGAPRKTVAFPNIKARIAELENRSGFGYSVTARITFTPQGWVSMVELTQASGDPRIDNIFRNELRKIRIEESPAGNTDTVLKSFIISVQ